MWIHFIKYENLLCTVYINCFHIKCGKESLCLFALWFYKDVSISISILKPSTYLYPSGTPGSPWTLLRRPGATSRRLSKKEKWNWTRKQNARMRMTVSANSLPRWPTPSTNGWQRPGMWYQNLTLISPLGQVLKKFEKFEYKKFEIWFFFLSIWKQCW